MKFGGIQRCTLIDFPGVLACVVFTPGCNMRCPYCHNPDLVLPERLKELKNSRLTQEEVLRFLKSRQGLLEGVSICGGEPTVHKDLPQFIRVVADLGFKVKLDTNGSNAEMVIDLLNTGLLDYVAVDMKHAPHKYSSLWGRRKATAFWDTYTQLLQALKSGKAAYEYRTTLIEGFHTEEDFQEIVTYLSGIENFYLQRFIPGKTLHASFVGRSFSLAMTQHFQSLAKEKIQHVGIRW